MPKQKKMDTVGLTRRWLHKRDWLYGKADYFNNYTKRSHDMFGFIDVFALPPLDECHYGSMIAIQITSYPHMRDRIKKASECEAFWRVLGCTRFEVWGWERILKPGAKRPTYMRHMWSIDQGFPWDKLK